MTHSDVTLQFKYHIAGVSDSLTEDSPLLKIPLLGKDAGGILLYEYFEQAEKFIKLNEYSAIRSGLQFVLKKSISLRDIEQIDICLEKHGAFYHPAKVQVTIKKEFSSCSVNAPILFVLNTAVSSHGLALIHYEYHLLKYLNEIDGNCFVPKVFDVQTMTCKGLKIAFMFAIWFDGYREFHLTDDNINYTNNRLELIDKKKLPITEDVAEPTLSVINIWNSDGTITPFYPPDYFEIYEKASEILTYFYNLKTSEHIFPWHHAAGDFIAKRTENGFDVKLITVRGYRPIVELNSNRDDCGEVEFDCENNIEDVYKALLLFFLNLTLRMRIDRIDGTGDWVLVNSDVMPFILKGFFRSLEQKLNFERKLNRDDNRLKNSFLDEFKSYLSQFSHQNLYQILMAILDTIDFPNTGDGSFFSQSNSETLFIKKHLKSHSQIVSYHIDNYISSVQ